MSVSYGGEWTGERPQPPQISMEDLRQVVVKPGATIVYQTQQRLSPQKGELIMRYLKMFWPGNKVAIISEGELLIMEEADGSGHGLPGEVDPGAGTGGPTEGS